MCVLLGRFTADTILCCRFQDPVSPGSGGWFKDQKCLQAQDSEMLLAHVQNIHGFCNIYENKIVTSGLQSSFVVS